MSIRLFPRDRHLRGPRRSALALLGFLLAGCAGDAAPGSDAAVPVVVRPLARLERPDYVGLSGDVEGLRTANLGFQVPGQVQTVALREGQPVREGELIAALDPRDYEFNLELAAAQRERAEQEFARARVVFEQRGIPENDFQKAETAVRMAKAQEGLASKKLADARIVAPFSGVLARRSVEPGEIVGPGFPVFTLVQVDPVQVRIGVPEMDIEGLAVGQRATVTIPSLGGAVFEGRVRVVGIAADPASRTYAVKVEVPNPGRRIRPGMIAEVRVENDTRITAFTIPAEAVVRDADGVTRVFVYDPSEQRVYARRVEVGAAYGTEVEIRSGLTGDERVVIGGQHRVREGSRVTAQVSGAADSTAAPTEAPAAP